MKNKIQVVVKHTLKVDAHEWLCTGSVSPRRKTVGVQTCAFVSNADQHKDIVASKVCTMYRMHALSYSLKTLIMIAALVSLTHTAVNFKAGLLLQAYKVLALLVRHCFIGF